MVSSIFYRIIVCFGKLSLNGWFLFISFLFVFATKRKCEELSLLAGLIWIEISPVRLKLPLDTQIKRIC